MTLYNFPKGVVYIVYKIGPSTDPWGTPCARGREHNLKSLHTALWILWLRYDLNHS